jgi:aldose 1-epimerase
MEIREKHLNDGICFIEFKLTEKFSITFSNLGGSIVEIKFADKFNTLEPITLMPAYPLSWISHRTFAGSIIGPLAGRYDPKDTILEKNRGALHFHGGTNGYDRQLWQYNIVQTEDQATIIFSLLDQENDLSTQVTYTLTAHCCLSMEIVGETSCEALFNPTNHLYFNLNGDPFQTVENHTLYLNAAAYFQENEQKLLTTQTPILAGSQLDFSAVVGKTLHGLKEFGGLDTTFLFGDKQEGCIIQPENGRGVHISTTLPAVVIFTFNSEQPLFNKDGRSFPNYAGITFETQYPANNLSQCRITKEQPYYSKTDFTFFLTYDKAK